MRRVFGSAVLAAIVAASGLSLAQAQPQPPQPPAPDAAASGAASADPALALIQDRCAMCHESSLATDSRRSPADWNDLVHAMMRKGANLNEDEAAQVVAYLSKNNADTAASQP